MRKILKLRAIMTKILIRFSMATEILDKLTNFYFIGIGGVSMSGLAKLLISLGKSVAGSDRIRSDYTDELENCGVKVCIGERESVADYDAVVYTDAVQADDWQLVEAKQSDKIIFSRGQLLYEIGRKFKKVIAVSGCHGKTTCTAMLAHIFYAAEKGFAAHIGGRDKRFSNGCFFGNFYLITEACEYKKNFLFLKPDIAVILNSEPDHLECYGSAENLRSAYLQFSAQSAATISLFGDMEVNGITFGIDVDSDFSARNLVEINGAYSFDVFEKNRNLGKIKLNVYGKHNVLNALAAIAVSRKLKIPFEAIREGVASFTGVERRFEELGCYKQTRVIADYAHHPNEIRATLRTARNLTYGRIFVIFQPHTYSRTKNLLKEFIEVLSETENLLIYRTFAAREYFDDAGSALTLSQNIKKSRYGDEAGDITDFIETANSGDLILFLGAGDIYEVAKNIIKNQTLYF